MQEPRGDGIAETADHSDGKRPGGEDAVDVPAHDVELVALVKIMHEPEHEGGGAKAGEVNDEAGLTKGFAGGGHWNPNRGLGAGPGRSKTVKKNATGCDAQLHCSRTSSVSLQFPALSIVPIDRPIGRFQPRFIDVASHHTWR